MGIKSPRTWQKWSCSEWCWAFMIYWSARSDGLRPEALLFHWNSDFSLMKERCKTKVRDRESHWAICDSEDPDSNSKPKRKKQRAENNSLLNEWTVIPAHFFQLGEQENKLPLLSKAFSSPCAPNCYLVILEQLRRWEPCLPRGSLGPRHRGCAEPPRAPAWCEGFVSTHSQPKNALLSQTPVTALSSSGTARFITDNPKKKKKNLPEGA